MKRCLIAILFFTSMILTGCETQIDPPIIIEEPNVSFIEKENLDSDYVSW